MDVGVTDPLSASQTTGFLAASCHWLSNSFKYRIKARAGEIQTICGREGR